MSALAFSTCVVPVGLPSGDERTTGISSEPLFGLSLPEPYPANLLFPCDFP